jgi:hypothetical protein
MAYTGPRVSEVLALLWPELEIDDPDSAAVSYNLQLSRRVAGTVEDGPDSRTVQLPRGMTVVLKAHHLASGRPADGYVFCEDDGTPLDHRKVARELRAAEVRTGLADPRRRGEDLTRRDPEPPLVPAHVRLALDLRRPVDPEALTDPGAQADHDHPRYLRARDPRRRGPPRDPRAAGGRRAEDGSTRRYAGGRFPLTLPGPRSA